MPKKNASPSARNRAAFDAYEKMQKAALYQTFVVFNGAEHVCNIIFKFPRDGAGRLTAYVFTPGGEDGWETDSAKASPWQTDTATGYGYDKRQAALVGLTLGGVMIHDYGSKPDGGYYGNWQEQLRENGLTVIQAL